VLDEGGAAGRFRGADGDPVTNGRTGAVDDVLVELAGEGGGDAVGRGVGGEGAEAAEEVDADAGGDEAVVAEACEGVGEFG